MRAFSPKCTTLVLVFLSVASCASSQHAHEELGGERIDPMPVEASTADEPDGLSATDRARAFARADLCAREALDLHRIDRELGWELLFECAARDDFASLDVLLNAPWLHEVRQRGAQGIVVLSRTLARRGGNLAYDLALCRDRGLPLLGLPEAVESPEATAGRWVLVRAKVVAAFSDEQPVRYHLAETELRALHFENKFGEAHALEEIRKGRSVEDARRSEQVVVASHTVSIETGRELSGLVDAKQALPIEEGAELLFLVRLEDVRPGRRATQNAPMLLTAARIVEIYPSH